MEKRKFTFIWGVFAALFAFTMNLSALINHPVDGVYYYLRIDTADNHAGYLQVDPANPGKLIIAEKPESDYALWRIFDKTDEDNYSISNKATVDTLAFDVPEQVDTTAVMINSGVLNQWSDLSFSSQEKDSLKTYYIEDEDSVCYYLSYDGDSVILSHSDSEKTAMTFIIERPKSLPDENTDYRLKVSTSDGPIGFLGVDTTRNTYDSITVSNIFGGSPSLWRFVPDTVISDTTYFEVYNVGTGSILAFNLPDIACDDTVAFRTNDGAQRSWAIPFFVEDNGTGKFVVFDAANNISYYLGMKDDTVKLISDITEYRYLTFALEEDILVPAITDVYKAKRVNASDTVNNGKFLAADIRGGSTYIDEVYAHIPDGQFVVYKNRYNLMNRLDSMVHLYDTVGAKTDSLKYVVIDGELVPNQYTNGVDTFEVTPVDMGSYRTDSRLGYKYIAPNDLKLNSYVFSQNSVDSLDGRVMGYNQSDSLVMILDEGDTARFVLSLYKTVSNGAPEVADIPKLERDIYYLRSFEDTSLYMTKNGNDIVMRVASTSFFYIKEDTVPGEYYFIDNNEDNIINKILIDSTKYLGLADIDSAVTHTFTITVKDRRPPAEPNPYEYLTSLPDGSGLYEFRVFPPFGGEKWLTKDYYDYAVLGKEGESMLRAGSFTQYDMHLWVDVAGDAEGDMQWPSFYIVKVDTAAADFNTDSIPGYFLHVMDSTALESHEKSVYTDKHGDEFNRLNFVKAKRHSANELLLDRGADALQARDSIGFAGKNEDAINEYRFYLQKIDDVSENEYYLVSEAGYGDGSNKYARGYLSYAGNTFAGDTLYLGPRDEPSALAHERRNLRVTFVRSTVSNEVIPPAVIEELSEAISIAGGTGQINILNAAGEEAVVFNILGQQVARKYLYSDSEFIPASRGILIVRVGTKAQKVVVK